MTANGYDPLAFHQPERLFGVQLADGRWLRSAKGGRPILRWDLVANPRTFITGEYELADDVAKFCRLVEETAHVAEIVPEHQLRQ